jgi:hypothetical protein
MKRVGEKVVAFGFFQQQSGVHDHNPAGPVLQEP